MKMDIWFFNLINSHRYIFLDVVAYIFSNYLFIFLGISFLLLFICFSHNIERKIKNLCIVGFSFLSQLILINGILKNIFYRPRPFLVLPQTYLLGPVSTGSSFPSNHTAIVASIIIAFVLLNKKYWPALFVILLVG